MIEISSAVSSSISSTRAGIVASPAAFEARQRRSPAISWKLAVLEGPDEDRLQDAVLADRRGELVERRPRRRRAAAARGSADPVDVDDPDAAARPALVVRQQADDGGGELALLGETTSGGGPEISSGQGRPPLARARGRSVPRPTLRRRS